MLAGKTANGPPTNIGRRFDGYAQLRGRIVRRVVVAPEGLDVRLRAEGLHGLTEELRVRE